MPRTPRVLLPDTPHHVVQRGHNSGVVFAAPEDFRYYLDNLREWKQRLGVRIHAWCLMTNHVHLVADPGSDVTSLGQLMRRLAGRQTRRVNRLERRTGTLWDGRYDASPIQTDRYLLACTRYVDLNPVRARMVARPEDYPWSSYRQRAGLVRWDWLDADPCYPTLGSSPRARAEAYAALVAEGIGKQETAFIAEAVRRNQLTGDARFVDEVERRLGRRIEHRRPGRPRRRPGRQEVTSSTRQRHPRGSTAAGK